MKRPIYRSDPDGGGGLTMVEYLSESAEQKGQKQTAGYFRLAGITQLLHVSRDGS